MQKSKTAVVALDQLPISSWSLGKNDLLDCWYLSPVYFCNRDNSGSGIGNTTLIQTDAHSRSFKVERVYFNNLPNPQLPNPLIWIEGSFESWMASDVKVKGQFRIKTQASF